MTPEQTIRAQQVADELNGTCNDIAQVVTDEELQSIEFCRAVDDITMKCDSCGWYVDADEINDNGDCEECQSDT